MLEEVEEVEGEVELGVKVRCGRGSERDGDGGREW